MGMACVYPMAIGLVQFFRLRAGHSNCDRESGSPQRCRSFSLDRWIRILHRDHYTADTRAKDFRNTGRSAFFEMTAGLKRDIQCGALSLLSCLPECEDFCVRSSWSEMIPPSNDLALTNHQGPDHRIRTCRSPALCRQAKGQGHEAEIVCSVGHRLLRRKVDGLRAAGDFFPAGFVLDSAIAAWAAANRAIATRKGEQLT